MKGALLRWKARGHHVGVGRPRGGVPRPRTELMRNL